MVGNTETGQPSVGRRLNFVFKIAVSIGLLTYLWGTLDVQKIVETLSHANYLYLWVALGLLFLQIILGAIRWQLIATILYKSNCFPMSSAMTASVSAMFFNQFAPSSIGGDAYRTWHLHNAGYNITHSLTSVLIDRIIALLGLLVLVMMCLPLAFSTIGNLASFYESIWTVTAAIIIVLVFLFMPRVLFPFKTMPRSLKALANVLSTFKKMVREERHVPFLLALSIGNHAVTSIIFYVIGVAIGVTGRIEYFLVLVPPIILAMMLPVSVGGWGVREVASVTVFNLVGISAEESLMISVLFGSLVIASSIPGAVIWLFSVQKSGGRT